MSEGRKPVPMGPVRVLAAVVAAGALTWSATAVGGHLGVDPGGRVDAAVESADVGTTTGEGGAAGPSGPSMVRSATLVCAGGAPPREGAQDSRQDSGRDGATQVVVRAATAPPEVVDDAIGSGPAGGEGATLTSSGGDAPLAAGGEAVDIRGPDTEGAGAVLTSGPGAAPGLVAAQLARSAAGGERGLSLAACSQPSEVVHLLGGGEGAGRAEHVVVTNPGTDAVTVDLEVWGTGGPADVTGGRGLVVPPQGRTVHPVDALAPGVEAPAVRVTASGGPVVAHLAEGYRDGTVDLGAEVVPAAADPARQLVVPALPVGVAAVTDEEDRPAPVTVLRLLATEQEAVVELRALTPEGAVTPSEPVVRVPAGSTVEVPVEGLPDGSALRVRSDEPVTAAMLVRLPPSTDDPVVVDDAGEGTSTTADASSTTGAPDGAGSTGAPDGAERVAPRVIHPAGELAWVGAAPLATDHPVGLAVPDLTGVPDAGAALAVSAVDGTSADVVWLTTTGPVVEQVVLAHDSTSVLEVPDDALAVWVRATGQAGIAASLRVRGGDEAGPYLGASTLPAVPWARTVTAVTRVVP